MALLTWDDRYSVGVCSLDSQHSLLFKLINELAAAMASGNPRNLIAGVLRRLLVYTRNHFSAEEAILAATRYPGLEQHRQTHRRLTKHVEEFEARFERGERAEHAQLLDFLRDWVTDHVLRSDKEYGPWINRIGVR
jgi:hemerythrin